MRKIKKGDNVIVISGKDKGKTGEVLAVSTKQNRAVIKGVNIMKRHQKPNPTLNTQGGIIAAEHAIDISNVMLVDPKTGKPTRAGFSIKDNKKTRVYKTSKQAVK
jgi:large subunit ribosomal protein L24